MSTTTSAQPAQLTRNERLDRLPFNKAHRKLLVASGIGWAFDAMDVGLVSFVVAAIAADPALQPHPRPKSHGAVHRLRRHGHRRGSGRFIADRVGRKTVFTATLIIFGIANGAMALSWSLGMLLGARLIIGLGLGAELPVASTLVSEFSPTKQRGRMTVLLESFWPRLDRRRHDRLLRDPEHRRLGLALGAGHRRAATALRNRHPRAHPRIRAIPRSQGSRRRSRKGRALLRGSRGSSPGNLSQGQAAAEDQDARTVRLQVPGPHHRHLARGSS